jgi:tetratricopeptide (TPR) repeat protein
MMLTAYALLAGLLGQAPPLPAGHPDIQPMAHANPSGPEAAEFDPSQPLPAGHPAVRTDGGAPGGMSVQDILARLDTMKAELKNRPKTAEIEFALGNLYYENSRWPDAIDAYRQLLERAQAPLERFLALRAKAQLPPSRPSDCEFPATAGSQPTFDVLISAADDLATRGRVKAALACYEVALMPMTVALTRRGNAWFLIGNDDLAIADHERVLEILPGSPDNLFFLGAILFESGDGDQARLRRAKDDWQRFLKSNPDPERAQMVSKDMVRLQMAIDNHGHVPAEMPPQMRAMAVGPIAPAPAAPQLDDAQRKTVADADARGEAALTGKQWEAAVQAFGEARKLDRGDLRAARGTGIALLNLGKLLAAEDALRDALGRSPEDSLALYELGEVFFKNEHYAGASRFWTQVMEQDPKLAEQQQLQAKLQAAQQAQ